jgi:hypothetical protein
MATNKKGLTPYGIEYVQYLFDNIITEKLLLNVRPFFFRLENQFRMTKHMEEHSINKLQQLFYRTNGDRNPKRILKDLYGYFPVLDSSDEQ